MIVILNLVVYKLLCFCSDIVVMCCVVVWLIRDGVLIWQNKIGDWCLYKLLRLREEHTQTDIPAAERARKSANLSAS